MCLSSEDAFLGSSLLRDSCGESGVASIISALDEVCIIWALFRP